jgi:hypothetical protein
MWYWGVVMQDPACELPRISIPRTRVNKGNKKVGWALVAGPAPSPMAFAALCRLRFALRRDAREAHLLLTLASP